MKKLLTLMMAMVMAFALASCGGSGSGDSDLPEAGVYPMTLTDGIGNTVVLEEEPDKIASLSPSCTEILYALGLGDKIVGVSTWCTYPEETAKVAKIGDTFSVNIEKLIEMETDLVFVSGHAGSDAVSALGQAGIAVYTTSTVTLDDIYHNINVMGAMTNTADAAAAIVADMQADAEGLQEKYAASDSKKVFIDLGDLYSTSKVDYLGHSLPMLNTENIAYEYDYTSPRLSAETVIEQNPDVYIVLCSEADFVMPDGFEEIKAFKEGNVHYIPYDDPRVDMITRDGPRFVDGLKVLGDLVHETGEK
ncbi:MAG: ABC transporter substrate-binding protein [Firmicutes bacterium]|nr:ABC transporter substrate-binding protein [Bacillota bacterium]